MSCIFNNSTNRRKGRRKRTNKPKKLINVFCLFFLIVIIFTGKNMLINKSQSTQGVYKAQKTASNVTNIVKHKKKNIELNKYNRKYKNYSIDASKAYTLANSKLAFLTFDDGPTPNVTPEILNVLKKYNVKATFFVLGNLVEQNKDILKRIVNEGHALGNHSYSHDYHKIYSNINSFVNEINKTSETIKNVVGEHYVPKLVRFPGGSFGKDKNIFKNKLKQEDYSYVDWNALTGDAEGQNIPPLKLINNLKKTTANKKHVVILMHDAATKKTTVQALPGVIEYLKQEKYNFKTLK
ncbi:polysaccharide deacetylase family protein [Haloimpatiens sp. FM7330]|uniref:polysaccharide deacetylase family protein n=1 Tax=Haloimpatiens sp. FM7330 TaxID=3298610 RepID=UPI00362AF7DE